MASALSAATRCPKIGMLAVCLAGGALLQCWVKPWHTQAAGVADAACSAVVLTLPFNVAPMF